MGCGRKTHKFAALTNSRLLPDNKYPRALKDSTASYIKEYPEMTNKFAVSLADYNNHAIEQGIVPMFRKARRFAESTKFAPMGVTSNNITIPDFRPVETAVRNLLHSLHGSDAQINYLTLDEVNFAHLVKQTLSDKYGYNSLTNSLSIKGTAYWLKDAVMHLNYKPDNPLEGASFTAPAIPGRKADYTRPYTPWIYRSDIPDVVLPIGNKVIKPRTFYNFKEKARLSLIKRYYNTEQEVHTKLIVELKDLETGEITTKEEVQGIIKLFKRGNVSNTTGLTEYKSELIDTEQKTETIGNITTVTTVKTYERSYYDPKLEDEVVEILFSDLFFYEPDFLPHGVEDPTPEQLATVEKYKKEYEWGDHQSDSDIFSSIYIISAELLLTNDKGEPYTKYYTFVDNRLDANKFKDADIQAEVYSIVKNELKVNNFGFFMPSLYLMLHGLDVSAEYEKSKGLRYRREYELYSDYARRLNIDYKTMLKDIYESAKEENEDSKDFRTSWDRMRTAYITFGIDIKAEGEIEAKYLYEFFNVYADTSKSSITLKDADPQNTTNTGNIKPGDDINDYLIKSGIAKDGTPNPFTSINLKDIHGTSICSWDSIIYREEEAVLYPDKEFKPDTHYATGSKVVVGDSVVGGSGGMLSKLIKRLNLNNVSVFTKQISPTTVAIIEVWNYRRSTAVHKGQWADSDNSKEYQDAATLVPLDYTVAMAYMRAYTDKEAILSKSMHLEFLSYMQKKEKWYQSGFFKLVVTAISIGAMVVFPPAGLAAATAGSTAALVITSTVISMSIGIAIDMMTKMLIKAFGVDKAGKIAAVIAIAALAWGTTSALSAIKAGVMKTLQIFFNKITVYMTQFSNALMNQSAQLIGVEMEEEAKSQKEKLKELKTYADEIFAYQISDDIDFTGVNRNYISPHLNIGSTIDEIMHDLTDYNKLEDCIEFIHNYADSILALPTLDDTIQAMYKYN